MNIVLIGTAYPFRGAMAHLCSLLYKHLDKHSVSVVTFIRQYPELLFPGKTQKEQGGMETAIPAEQLIDSINPITWWKTAKIIAKKKPDVLIFRYWLPFFAPCFGVISGLVRRWTGAKTIFICDNIIPHERRFGDSALTKFAFRFVDYFIVQSRSVERELNQLFPKAKYKFSPHPVFEIFGNSKSKTEARRALDLKEVRYILFFGYIRKYKGLHILIDAMRKIDSSLSIKLIVAGEFYDSEKSYRRQVADLKLESVVKFYPDYIPNKEVVNYFCAADVVILPYLDATQSGVTQIAYQFDRPVIATDVGGLSEVALHDITGFIVPPNNPDLLADAIERFYRENKSQQFEANVKIEKQKYSWEAFVETIESFFK